MNDEKVLYDLMQLMTMLGLIDQCKSDVKIIEKTLNNIGALRNLLNLDDEFWLTKFDKLIDKTYWKNEWIIITLDKDNEFFPDRTFSLDDENFIKKSYLDIIDLFKELRQIINLKIKELKN
jgi:hypothetical protein